MPKPPVSPADRAPIPEGERIAKVLARAGVASRRSAEILIVEGRVAVNGKIIDSPALNIGPRDRVTLDGKPLAAPEPTRVWLYHKPLGLVTSERDEKGRETVFDSLPEGMPRVMSVGRLDLNSEGLLLLTNDGDLKRRLELPSTGWLRKYRVRVNGTPTEAMLAPLKAGITVDGERFAPMMVTLDRQQGANAWLSVGLREGRNREVRRALESVGLTVNRLIRTAYGPFQLGDLPAGAVEELRPRVLRDQLGLKADEVAEGRAAPLPARAPDPLRRAKSKPRGEDDARSAPGTAPRPAPVARQHAEAKPSDKPFAKPAIRAAPRIKPGDTDMGTDPKAGRRSWGAKSHGGGRNDAAGTGEKPRSWGTKSARPTVTTPNRPGKGPRAPR